MVVFLIIANTSVEIGSGEWSAVPRQGEIVRWPHDGGGAPIQYRVHEVVWDIGRNRTGGETRARARLMVSEVGSQADREWRRP